MSEAYVIRNDRGEYWSNLTGLGSLEGCTLFTPPEKGKPALPLEGRWEIRSETTGMDNYQTKGTS